MTNRFGFVGHAVPLVAMALPVLGCSPGCTGSPDPPRDATVHIDASADHPVADRTIDQQTVDVLAVDDAGWAAAPWVPRSAHLYFATDPARMLPQQRWQPCTDGWVGCREFVQESACAYPRPTTLNAHLSGEASTPGASSHLPWISYYYRETVADIRYMTLVYSLLDRAPLIGWRWREEPLLDVIATANSLPARSSVVSYLNVYNETAGVRTVTIVRSSERFPLGSSAPIAVLDGQRDLAGSGLTCPWASDSVFGVAAESIVGYLQGSTPARFRTFRDPTYAFSRSPATVWNDTFFWRGDILRGGIGSEWWLVQGADPPRRLLGDGSEFIVGFDTDGEVMVWCVGHDWVQGTPNFPRADLWIAPFTTDPAAVRPRRLLAMDLVNMDGVHAMGDGYYVTGSNEGGMYIVDLATGDYWRVTSPAGTVLLMPLYVNRSEVGFYTRASTGLQCQHHVRVRLDSLGAPRHPMP